MMKTHRAGLFIELENLAQLHISPIAFPQGGSTGLPVSCDISGGIDDSPIDVARNLIQLVDRLVCGGLGTGCQQ